MSTEAVKDEGETTSQAELSRKGHPSSLRPPKVAYFSMEVALAPDIPTYSGGLGILAGDTLRSAADLGVPMVGVSLLYRKGYFRQELDERGRQSEIPVAWEPEDRLERMRPLVTVTLEGRPVHICCWRYIVFGINGHLVPVYLLDTDVATNSPWDRTLTDTLYGGDEHYRLCQEFILGVGGTEILSQLEDTAIETFHMNEGHSALLVLRLLEKRLAETGTELPLTADVAAIRRHCVFTTHTPVPAGHDRFPGALVRQVLGERRAQLLYSTGFTGHDDLNMTHLALHHSNYVNGVAMRHGEVSQEMFPQYRVKALTNGVHAATWTAPAIRELFDREIPEWRHDNMYLRYAINIPLREIREAHRQAKLALLGAIRGEMGIDMDPDVFTIGFARRATAYKRADLFWKNPERLRQMVEKVGPIQVVYGGKAHPRDEDGKVRIQHIYRISDQLKEAIRFVYVPNYDWRWGGLICGGVDLWLNTPVPTREASGTSGMKAALNGVPSLSVLDGWWVEGHVEGVTGWAIENAEQGEGAEAESIYDKLSKAILPLYYNDPEAYAMIMRGAIALNASFFNTQRMLLQYIFNAYSTNGRGQG